MDVSVTTGFVGKFCDPSRLGESLVCTERFWTVATARHPQLTGTPDTAGITPAARDVEVAPQPEDCMKLLAFRPARPKMMGYATPCCGR